jgi:hypothetical protein
MTFYINHKGIRTYYRLMMADSSFTLCPLANSRRFAKSVMPLTSESPRFRVVPDYHRTDFRLRRIEWSWTGSFPLLSSISHVARLHVHSVIHLQKTRNVSLECQAEYGVTWVANLGCHLVSTVQS